MHSKFIHKGITYVVEVINHNKFSMILKYQDDRYVCYKPFFAFPKQVNKFISQKMPLLIRQLAKRKTIIEAESKKPKLICRDHIYLLGEKHKLTLIRVDKKRDRKIFIDNFVIDPDFEKDDKENPNSQKNSNSRKIQKKDREIIFYSEMENWNEMKEYIIKWLKKLATKRYALMLKHYEKKMGTYSHTMTISRGRFTLGSNNTVRKKINLSLHGMLMGEEVMTYLVVHEIAHDFVKKHNAEFWAIVAKYYPDYRNIRKIIRRFQR